MTLTFDSEHLLRDVTRSAQPTSTSFWFKADQHWCTAFLHEADTTRLPSANGCAVLCPSIGLEQLRGARHQRALARKLSASGITTLRFSFQGTDNSSGHATLDGDARSLVLGWKTAVLRAVEIARAHSGCTRVVVIARRLGALVALAALRNANDELLHDVELVLWDPVSSGSNFLRDLRIRERLRASTTPDMLISQSPDAPIHAIEQTFEFNRATVRDIGTLELCGALPPDVHTHIVAARLDRSSRATIDAWPAKAVSVHIAPDAAFNFDLLEGPELPGITFNALSDIATGSKRASQSSAMSMSVSDMYTQADVLLDQTGCSSSLHLPALRVQEQWMCVHEATSLHGVITVPFGLLPHAPGRSDASRVRKVVIMLNMGVLASPGEGDANMLLARRLAKVGLPVLRLDFRGTGESPAQSPLSENRAYGRGQTKDVANAVHFTRTHFPKAEIVVQGICSGAYWAIHAAAQSIGIDRIIAVNPQLYAGSQISQRNVDAMQKVQLSMGVTASIGDASKWRKLLTGRYSTDALRQTVQGFASRVESKLRRSQGAGEIGGMRDLDLDALFPPGTYFDLVFSRNDLGYQYLMQHGSARIRHLKSNRDFRLHTIDDADHTFSTPAQRTQLDRVIAQLLGLQYARVK